MCSTKKTQGRFHAFVIIKQYSVFISKFYYAKSKEMMREMEKVFENLKEEFNRKMASDSFLSYFVKNPTADDGAVSSDSYEEITMDYNITVTVEEEDKCPEDIGSKIEESLKNDQRKSDKESDGIEECCMSAVDIDVVVEDEEEIEDVKGVIIINGSSGDNEDDAETMGDGMGVTIGDEIKVTQTEEEIGEEMDDLVLKCEGIKDRIIRISSAERPLNVIDEEETNEQTLEIGTVESISPSGNVDIEEVTTPPRCKECILEHIEDPVDLNDVNVCTSEIYVEILTEEEVNGENKLCSANQRIDSVKEIVKRDSVENEKVEENILDTSPKDSKSKLSTVNDSVEDEEEERNESETSHNRDSEEDIGIDTQWSQLRDAFNSPIENSSEKRNFDLQISMSEIHEVPPTPDIVKTSTLKKMMWSEMPEVLESGILLTLPHRQIQHQEAMFEVITTEASYYRSLMILTTHFFESPLFKVTSDNKENLISSTDRHHIFSNILLVTKASLNFLNDLQKRWDDEKPLLKRICDIILEHANGEDFKNYVIYLRNQEYQSKAIKRLTENESFKQQLNALEDSPECGKLSMDSYLLLPMKRLATLKLCVDTLLKIMYHPEIKNLILEEDFNIAEMTALKLKMLLDTSNSEKGIMDQKSILLQLINKMDFPTTIKRITLSDKILIKEDEVRVHHQTPLRFIRKISKKKQPSISLILFNDLLMVAKQKNSRYLVLDYCEISRIEVSDTKYKSIVSSADVSKNASMDLVDDVEDADLRKVSLTSLGRSKSHVQQEEPKRMNSGLSSSFKSLSLYNRMDEQEIINNSFSLKFVSGQTDIFSVPIALLAKDKLDRDKWVTLLNNGNTSDGRLHKTTSLKHNVMTKEDFGINKSQSCFNKRKDD